MDADQVHMLQKFGHENIVCIDSIRGLKENDLELITLMVVDEFGLGFPCCFMFTNLKDTKMYSIMFSIIKDKAGAIMPKTIMTNHQVESFYSAWESTMGAVPQRLSCSWHIESAWKRNICKISGPMCKQKREAVYRFLKVMQSMTDENSFNNALKQFNCKLLNDLDTRDFSVYFDRTYGDTVKLWAHCYRNGLEVSSNLESVHRTIKYHYLNGYKFGQLEKIITTIRKYTHDKYTERVNKVTITKTKKIQEIEKIHDTSISLDLTIIEDGVNNWIIESEHMSSHFYKVKKISDNVCCATKCSACKLCIHSFHCTCPDYQVKSVICHHIHVLALNMTSLENDASNTPIASDNYTAEHNFGTTTKDDTNEKMKSNETDIQGVYIKPLRQEEEADIQKNFKIKAISLANRIDCLHNIDILKEALQKLDALETFMITSKTKITSEAFSKNDSEPPNKKIRL